MDDLLFEGDVIYRVDWKGSVDDIEATEKRFRKFVDEDRIEPYLKVGQDVPRIIEDAATRIPASILMDGHRTPAWVSFAYLQAIMKKGLAVRLEDVSEIAEAQLLGLT